MNIQIEKRCFFGLLAVVMALALFSAVMSGCTVEQPEARGTTHFGSTTVGGDLAVTGVSDFQDNVADSVGDLTVADDAIVTGTFNAQGNGDFDSALNVDGALTIDLTSDLQGNVYDSGGDLTVADDTVITGTLNVQGDADFDQAVNIDGNLDVTGDMTITGTQNYIGDITVTGDVTVTGELDVSDNIHSATGCVTVTDCLVVTGTLNVQDAGDFDSTLNVDGALTVDGNVTLGDDITDVTRLMSALRTWDGSDYWQDVTVSDVPGTYHNGWQAAYNITDWDSETTMTSLFAEVKVTTDTADSSVYGIDGMARMYGIVATGTSTGIGVFGEVLASYTATWPLAYAIYGQLEAVEAVDEITDGSVFFADLAGNGTFGTVDVLSVKTGDTYDYGIDFSPATAMSTADIKFQNGTELEETTDTVLTFSEFLAAEEQTALVIGAGETITPTGTYQPLTSAAAVTTSAVTAIADGAVNGQLLILANENITDTIIIKNGANTHLSGDITLGNDDTLTLMWDGADWLGIATMDNS